MPRIESVLWIAFAVSVLSGGTVLPSAGDRSKGTPTAQQSNSRQNREVIRDRYGRTLGEIRPVGSGRLEARNRHGRLLGRYDPKADETRDPSGRLLTKGNTLSALVMKAAESPRK
jgi:hypothetical protein